MTSTLTPRHRQSPDGFPVLVQFADPAEQRPAEPRDVFSRMARFAVDRPRLIITVWALLVPVLGVLALMLPSRLGAGGFDVPGSQSLQVQQILQTQFPGQSADAAVIVLTAAPNADPSVLATTVAAVRETAGSVDGVTGVRTYQDVGGSTMVAADGRTTYVAVSLDGDQNQQMRTEADLEKVLPQVIPSEVQAFVGGRAALYAYTNDISRADLEKAEIITFPVTLLVLLLVFGSAVAAGLPLLLSVVSLVVTLGCLYLLTLVTTLSVYVTNTASVIGIAVGIDYALFIVTRYREELARGVPSRDAVIRSMATAGRSAAISGFTVVVALAGMFLVDIQGFRSMAIGSMTVVLIAVAASMTLLPAVLGLIGPRIDRFAMPRRAPGRHRANGWHLWALQVMRHPVPYLIGALGALLLLAAPLTGIVLGQPSASTLPAGTPPRVASEQLAAAFGPGALGPVEIVVPLPGGPTDPGALTRIQQLTAALSADPHVAGVLSIGIPGAAGLPGLVSADGTSTRVVVLGTDVPQSDAGQDLVVRIRTAFLPQAGITDGLVGGQGASDLDLTDAISERLPWVIAAVLALSFVLLVITLRSIVLPIKAIVMNLLSSAAAFGVVVALFQWGWGSDLLQFHSEGFIQAFVPLFLFSVLFGLSMDYEVLLMSRMREEWDRTGSNQLAVARGLERTGRTVTSAALIMVVVFAAFTASQLLAFKAMGFGLAAAVLIDATIVRVVAVPATMRLLGAWNWWIPAWLDRVLPHLEAPDDQPEPVSIPVAELTARRLTIPTPLVRQEL